MQNMVEIISEATRWQLDEKMLYMSKAIPTKTLPGESIRGRACMNMGTRVMFTQIFFQKQAR